MSTTITEGWLKDKDGVKFAPKTLISQVIASDGVTLDEKLTGEFDKLDKAKADTAHTHIIANISDLSTELDTRDTDIKNYVDGQFTTKVGAQTVEAQLSAHNAADNAHADIRELIKNLSDRLDDFSGLDETTIKELEELLTLLEQEGDSLDEILAGKVNTSDIINNLTTNDAAKVLSAAQGAAIKTAMDAMNQTIGTKAEASALNDYVKTADLADGTVIPPKADSLNVTAAIGASNQPVYINSSGVPTAISYAINKSVPWDAVFTDTYPPNADGTTTLGLVKGGGDVSISNGVITVNDDSHNHVIANVDGLQDALNSKQATITGAATTITSSNLTANRALISNASGKVAVSSTITSTELGYLNGVTSNIQTQFNTITGTGFTAAKATADKNGKDITTTYALQSTVQSIIDGGTTVGKATNATSATTATKATQDGNGNNIANTYATKDELATGVTNKVPTTRKINNKPLSADITLTASDVNTYTKNEIDAAIAGIKTDEYTLPTASSTVKGGIKPGNGVYMNGERLSLNLADDGSLTTGTNGQLRVSNPLPSVTTNNNGQFLQVVNGAWAAVTINTAESGAF